MNAEIWSAKRVTFWVALAPAVVLSAALVGLGAPLLAPATVGRESIEALFLAENVRHCVPEGLEQTGYVLTVLAPVGFMLVALLALRRTRFVQLGPQWPIWVRRTVLALQAVVVVAGVVGWLYESFWGRHYFREWASAALVLAAFGIYKARGRWLTSVTRTRIAALNSALRAWPPIAWLLVCLWTVGLLLTCVFTDAGIGDSLPAMGHHLDFTMGEFAAALNGRTPLVDFFPQYQNLTPLLLAPVFELIGFDVTRFTLVMCGMSLAGFLLVYAVFLRVTGGPWKALALYLPFATISFYHADRASGGHYENAFNYFAVGPLRYLGVFAIAFAVAWFLRSPTLRRLALAAALAGAVAFNNLDFGFPAALALLFVALLFPPAGLRPWRPGALAAVAAGWLLATTAGIATVAALIRVTRGAWPVLTDATLFQKTFGLHGFYMLPLPFAGLYWIVFLTFMSAVLIALHESVSEPQPTAEHRLVNGMLAYGGVAGFGVLVYYIGRSHPSVLVAVFSIWLFVLVQLAFRARRDWQRLASPDGQSWYARGGLPACALLGLCLALAHEAVHYPNPFVQARRIARSAVVAEAHADEKAERMGEIVALIRRHAPPGAHTVIVYAQGHWLALRADVDNLFPFAGSGSIQSKAQVDTVMNVVASIEHAGKGLTVFGNPPLELAMRLRGEGFSPLEALGDFAVWSRAAAR